eukprot:PhF_6_TR43152/c1_g1_i2/m.66061
MLTCDIFKELDKLAEMDIMKSLRLDIPKVIVLGNESHGKSTLLERLIGYPVFPRDRLLCTKMPLRVMLRRGPMALSWVGLRDRSLTITGKQYVPLSLVSSVVKSIMDEAVRVRNKDVIDDVEVVISIQLPNCPNLEVLDLPGLVAANSAGTRQNNNLNHITTNLAQSVIEREKRTSIFLLVTDVRVPANQSLASALVQKNGIEHITLGVYTKLDVFVSEDGDTADLVKRMVSTCPEEESKVLGKVTLPHGWILSSSRLPNGVHTEVRRLNAMEEAEMQYFKKNFPKLFPKHSNSVGVGALRKNVTDLYSAFVVSKWIEHVQ